MNASPENPHGASWLAVAREPAIVERALRVAAVVGTLLVAINYTDRFLSGSLGSLDWIKMGMTYLVPYGVSTYTAVEMRRRAG